MHGGEQMYAFTFLAVNIIVSEIPDPGRRSRPGFCDIKLVYMGVDNHGKKENYRRKLENEHDSVRGSGTR